VDWVLNVGIRSPRKSGVFGRRVLSARSLVRQQTWGRSAWVADRAAATHAVPNSCHRYTLGQPLRMVLSHSVSLRQIVTQAFANLL
jgi:hypothetical protein